MKYLRANFLLVGLTFLAGAVLYPLAIWAVGQGLFPSSANGSLVEGPDGKPIGSRLIAQEFKGDEWFHSRPSAADYKADASGASNFGANNPKLRERVEKDLQSLPADAGPIPADAVTTSGSGLDPHITLRNAQMQADRVGKARGVSAEAIWPLLAEMATTPPGGLPIVNVLEVNRELAKRFPKKG